MLSLHLLGFALSLLLVRTYSLSLAAAPPPSSSPINDTESSNNGSHTHKVLILGGGVAGIIAARSLHERGIDDFLIIEARSEIGGRMMSATFGSKSHGNGTQYTIEQGANWIQGTQEDDGPANPILQLATKHHLKTQYNDLYESISTYDASGAVDYLDIFNATEDQYEQLMSLAGSRVDQNLVDISARTGYSLTGVKGSDPHAAASEYYLWDWEYAQTPAESSLIASAWNNNYTYDTDQGGFSEDNQLSVDQRGFKTLIQQEAADFLKPNQIIYNSTIKTIQYTKTGVSITLTNGQIYTGDYSLCTFSLGVLQNDDVVFEPVLPDYKQEAIQSMVMGTYTKIFMQFPKKFWFDTEMALYADSERGRYPIWQSLDHPNFFPGSGILFVTVTGDYSIRVEGLSNDQVKSEVLSILRLMYPNVTIPEPLDFFFPRWHSNALFRGSYSNWPPSFSSQHLSNLRANVNKLFFAGEATSRKYFGFLHGAYFEGSNIATVIADCIQKGRCTDLPRFPKITNASPYDLSGRSLDEL